MDNDQLEEISPPPEEGASPPQPAPPPVTAPSPGQGFPQLYRFMWGGIIVLIGSLLPFGPAVVTSMYEPAPEVSTAGDTGAGSRQEQLKDLASNLGEKESSAAPTVAVPAQEVAPSMPAVHGYETFTGALFLLFGLMLIGQMRSAIAARKVALGAVLLMFFPAGWTWFKIVLLTRGMDWFHAGDLYRLVTFERLTLEVGSGFLLVLIGSSYVVFGFFRALLGAASGGKKVAAVGAGAGSKRRSRHH